MASSPAPNPASPDPAAAPGLVDVNPTAPAPPSAAARVSAEALAQGYEPEKLGVRGLLIFFALFVLTAAALHGLLWLLMKGYVNEDQQIDAPRSVASAPVRPPGPPLQPSVGHTSLDYQDLDALRHEEDEMFRKFGWSVDPQTHEADIPPAIAQRVAEEAKARAAAGPVPPTTTGKAANTILPGPVPEYDLRQGAPEGKRP